MKTQEIDFSFFNVQADEFELPSRGLPYNKASGISNGKIHIKPWTTATEKIIDKLNTGNFYSILSRLVEASVVEPIVVEELTDQDLAFIVYWARALTYGSTYKISATCPSCGENISTIINIRDFEPTYLEKYDDVFDVDVPVAPNSDKVIKMKMKLPRVKDLILTSEIKYSDLLKMGIKVNSELHRYALCTTEMILPNANQDVLNSETTPNFLGLTIKKIWNSLPASSILYIRKIIEKYKHGYIEPVKVQCPACNQLFNHNPVLNDDFFRPVNAEPENDQELPNDI